MEKNQNIERRNFLKQMGVLTATVVAHSIPGYAKAFVPYHKNAWFDVLEKKLDPLWIRSLYNRGKVTTYLKSRNELMYIGMPIGGINCGTVYLGGDGRLWLWDIFNKNQEGIEPKIVNIKGEPWQANGGEKRRIRSRDGSAYVSPAKDIRPLEQGFALKIALKDRVIVKQFREGDWDEISFEGTYPVGTVRYFDKSLELNVTLEAFSPFIPLDEINSNLPATVLSWKIENLSTSEITADMLGWLENAVNKTSGTEGEWKNTEKRGVNSVAVFSEFKASDPTAFQNAGDNGSMCISLINANGYAHTTVNYTAINNSSFEISSHAAASESVSPKLTAGISTSSKIAPKASKKIDFALSWYFPNVGSRINVPEAREGHFYTAKFNSALEVSNYLADNFAKLSSQTHLWKNTWYNSTLPWWFLERTFLNISTLATTTSHRFKNGRSWAWEGVGACEGNCTHVWQYAQSVGRIFPGLERDNRQRVDLGISLQKDGGIWFRGEYDKRPAIDGQAGTVLRIYREHQMAADDTFLKNNWIKIKKTVQFVIDQDKNGDGMVDTPMENTLDAIWSGEISWIVGLCITAVKSGELMAIEAGDLPFAEICSSFVKKGKDNMEKQLFNGEYFIHKPDAKTGRSTIGSYNTSHIDQVYGQSYAFQVGLGRILDQDKTLSALRSLWKYNFTTDVGPYIKEHSGGRPYAVQGEGGMIMNTNPKNEENPYGGAGWQVGYFNECMSGFEHQVASHMIAEGLLDEGMIMTRTIHDRYHASKRNPFNEIECSDHYARAMASYGSFITACGFTYHGPKGEIGFAPKWDRKNFKAPFTTAEGWGTYSQKTDGNKHVYVLKLLYGSLILKTFKLKSMGGLHPDLVSVTIGGKKIRAVQQKNGLSINIIFKSPEKVTHGANLVITLI